MKKNEKRDLTEEDVCGCFPLGDSYSEAKARIESKVQRAEEVVGNVIKSKMESRETNED